MNLFSSCPAAKQLLDTNSEIKRKWTWSVEWLSEELRAGRTSNPGGGNVGQGGSGGVGGSGGGSYATTGGTYSNWSPPAQSNEGVNGYFLERSHSARLTLEKACELLPEEEEVRR